MFDYLVGILLRVTIVCLVPLGIQANHDARLVPDCHVTATAVRSINPILSATVDLSQSPGPLVSEGSAGARG